MQKSTKDAAKITFLAAIMGLGVWASLQPKPTPTPAPEAAPPSAPAPAPAPETAYQIGGISPGDSAEKIRALGYTRCEPHGGIMHCHSTGTGIKINGAPAQDLRAELDDPYTTVTRVTVEIPRILPDARCKKMATGHWERLAGEPADPTCKTADLVMAAAVDAFGPPIHTDYWHNCGHYAARIERTDSTHRLILTKTDDTGAEINAQECRSQARSQADTRAAEQRQNDFTARMKSP